VAFRKLKLSGRTISVPGLLVCALKEDRRHALKRRMDDAHVYLTLWGKPL